MSIISFQIEKKMFTFCFAPISKTKSMVKAATFIDLTDVHLEFNPTAWDTC